MSKAYDLAVIGGGSAGFNAARVAADLGKRVAVIDGARALGGLCILRGCMPSKTLIYAAEVLHLAGNGAAFGLRTRGNSADMEAMQDRKRRIIRDFALHRRKQLTSGRFELIRSHARFLDSHTLSLEGGRTLRATHILVSTGSRVCVPPVPGLASCPFWTSDDVLNLDFKPRSVIVLGGGIVACELAQFLLRVGTRVCLIQRSSHLLKHFPEGAARVLEGAFADEGMEVLTRTEILRVGRQGQGVRVTFKCKGKTYHRTADHLFNALGRDPDTSRLALEAAGVKAAANGRIITNRWQQTNVPTIYAAGDCCGPHEIVHVAIQQGELAARHSAGVRGLRPVADTPLLNVVFTDPQVATLGMKESELRRWRRKFIAAGYPFDDLGKSILMNATRGYVRVLAEPRGGRILGAEIVGRDAGELIHSFSTPISMGATVDDMLRAPWYHPTLSEIVTYPLEEIADRIKRTQPQKRRKAALMEA